MKKQAAVDHGVLAGMLWFLSADAVHWLLTPQPDASDIRVVLVAAQVVVCLVAGVWVYRRGRSKEQELERGSSFGEAASLG